MLVVIMQNVTAPPEKLDHFHFNCVLGARPGGRGTVVSFLRHGWINFHLPEFCSIGNNNTISKCAHKFSKNTNNALFETL